MVRQRRFEKWLERRFGFGSADEATLEAIERARALANRGALRLVAIVAALTTLVFLAGVASGVLVRRTSPLWRLYLAAFCLEFLIAAVFAIRWIADRSRGGHRSFIGLSLVAVVLLNLLGMYAVGDRSIYLFALLGSALFLSAPLEWYVAAFSSAWLFSIAGLYLFFPQGHRLNHAVVMGTMTLLSIAAGLAVEAARMRAAVLRHQLELSNRELKELAFRDSLTGLFNRRFLMEWLVQQEAWADRSGRPLAIAIADLDLFKLVNDEAGHAVGDAVLAETGRMLAAGLRKTDMVARYGGEEFLLALPDTSLAEALPLLSRLQDEFRGMRVAGWDRPVTFSAGLASRGRGESSAAVIARADALLYQAKRSGRDRIEAEGSAS